MCKKPMGYDDNSSRIKSTNLNSGNNNNTDDNRSTFVECLWIPSPAAITTTLPPTLRERESKAVINMSINICIYTCIEIYLYIDIYKYIEIYI